MKFYNLGDKTFETDLSLSARSQNIKIVLTLKSVIYSHLHLL